ncbi:MAG TPA: phytoene/squalene synthase family protein [Euzebyales bacterium]
MTARVDGVGGERPGSGGGPGYHHPPPSTEIVADGAPAGSPVDLDASYELCRRLNAAHGRTYYFATRFLPRDRRHHVHALYGFARYADDLVDHFDLGWSAMQRRAALEQWSDGFLASLAVGHSDDPVLKAVIATVTELGIDHDDLRAFLRSMAMDLTVTRYETYDDLYTYVHGSAAVIGAMMLPVLGARHPDARDRAMDLGIAFQLTNFLRDVAEDWDRGRIYLPLEDLDRFGVTEEHFERREVTPQLRRLLAFESDRTRTLYRRAEQGWGMLEPRSQACIRIAHRLYGEILDRIEAADWQVFSRRASVPMTRKLAVAAREVVRRPRPVPPTA